MWPCIVVAVAKIVVVVVVILGRSCFRKFYACRLASLLLLPLPLWSFLQYLVALAFVSSIRVALHRCCYCHRRCGRCYDTLSPLLSYILFGRPCIVLAVGIVVMAVVALIGRACFRKLHSCKPSRQQKIISLLLLPLL